MYEPDGNELLVDFRNPDGERFIIAVDDEDYAHLIYQGWTAESDGTPIVREQVSEEDFRQTRTQP